MILTLGVQVSRRAYLKTLAPIIDEAVRREHRVIAILDRPPRKPGAERAHPTDFVRWPTIALTTFVGHSTTTVGRLDALVGLAFSALCLLGYTVKLLTNPLAHVGVVLTALATSVKELVTLVKLK